MLMKEEIMLKKSEEITVDPEFKKLIPPLREKELAELEASCCSEGIRDPLVVWPTDRKLLLLDGHHRYDISTRHTIPYDCVKIKLSDRTAAKIWIIRNQFGRRNLSLFQRCELALALESLIPSRQGERSDLGQNSDRSPDRPHRQAAEIASVSHDTYAKVKVIAAQASDDVKEQLRAGETSIHAEYIRLTSKAHVSHKFKRAGGSQEKAPTKTLSRTGLVWLKCEVDHRKEDDDDPGV